jgi:hypothetical protein
LAQLELFLKISEKVIGFPFNPYKVLRAKFFRKKASAIASSL